MKKRCFLLLFVFLFCVGIVSAADNCQLEETAELEAIPEECNPFVIGEKGSTSLPVERLSDVSLVKGGAVQVNNGPMLTSHSNSDITISSDGVATAGDNNVPITLSDYPANSDITTDSNGNWLIKINGKTTIIKGNVNEATASNLRYDKSKNEFLYGNARFSGYNTVDLKDGFGKIDLLGKGTVTLSYRGKSVDLELEDGRDIVVSSGRALSGTAKSIGGLEFDSNVKFRYEAFDRQANDVNNLKIRNNVNIAKIDDNTPIKSISTSQSVGLPNGLSLTGGSVLIAKEGGKVRRDSANNPVFTVDETAQLLMDKEEFLVSTQRLLRDPDTKVVSTESLPPVDLLVTDPGALTEPKNALYFDKSGNKVSSYSNSDPSVINLRRLTDDEPDDDQSHLFIDVKQGELMYADNSGRAIIKNDPRTILATPGLNLAALTINSEGTDGHRMQLDESRCSVCSDCDPYVFIYDSKKVVLHPDESSQTILSESVDIFDNNEFLKPGENVIKSVFDGSRTVPDGKAISLTGEQLKEKLGDNKFLIGPSRINTVIFSKDGITIKLSEKTNVKTDSDKFGKMEGENVNVIPDPQGGWWGKKMGAVAIGKTLTAGKTVQFTYQGRQKNKDKDGKEYEEDVYAVKGISALGGIFDVEYIYVDNRPNGKIRAKTDKIKAEIEVKLPGFKPLS